MAGVDPITLAVVGAGVGAMASPNDPIKGAILGGTVGFGGGSLAAGGVGSAASYGAAVPGLTATGPGSQAAMLAAQTGQFGVGGLASTAAAGAAPGSLASSFWGGVNQASMLGGGGAGNPTQMAMRGLQMANQQPTQPVSSPSQFRGAKQVNTTEPIQSLLAMAQPRRRERMSLL